MGEILHSFGSARQITLKMTIASSTDLDRALTAVRDVVTSHPRVLKDPAPITAIETVADTVKFLAKPWVSIEAWQPVQAELYPAIVDRLRRDKIPPFGLGDARAA